MEKHTVRLQLEEQPVQLAAEYPSEKLAVSVDMLKAIDEKPMIVKMPLMQLGSTFQMASWEDPIDEAVLAMVERDIEELRPPAYMGHGGLFGRESDDGGVGNWIGTERRGNWLYGTAYIHQHATGFRSFLQAQEAVGSKIGSSMVVTELWDDNKKKLKPLGEGKLRGIDFLSVGQAGIPDSEAPPDIAYLAAKTAANVRKEPVMANEQEKQAEVEARVVELENKLSHQEREHEQFLSDIREALQLDAADDPVQFARQLRSEIDELSVKLHRHEIEGVLDEFAAGNTEAREFMGLFLERDGKMLVSDAAEARRVLESVKQTSAGERLFSAARVVAHGPKTVLPAMKREVPGTNKSLGREFDNLEDEQRFINEENQRLGLGTVYHDEKAR